MYGLTIATNQPCLCPCSVPKSLISLGPLPKCQRSPAKQPDNGPQGFFRGIFSRGTSSSHLWISPRTPNSGTGTHTIPILQGRFSYQLMAGCSHLFCLSRPLHPFCCLVESSLRRDVASQFSLTGDRVWWNANSTKLTSNRGFVLLCYAFDSSLVWVKEWYVCTIVCRCLLYFYPTCTECTPYFRYGKL